MTYDPTIRTRTLARVVGPYMLVAGAAIVVRAADMPLFLPAFMQDGPLVFATGAFTLMAGLVMLAAHHHWSSPAAIAITLVGIAAALKGASLMIAPELGSELTAAIVLAPPALIAAAVLDIALGAWLATVGWFAKG